MPPLTTGVLKLTGTGPPVVELTVVEGGHEMVSGGFGTGGEGFPGGREGEVGEEHPTTPSAAAKQKPATIPTRRWRSPSLLINTNALFYSFSLDLTVGAAWSYWTANS